MWEVESYWHMLILEVHIDSGPSSTTGKIAHCKISPGRGGEWDEIQTTLQFPSPHPGAGLHLPGGKDIPSKSHKRIS